MVWRSDLRRYHKTASHTRACKALHASNFSFTMRCWAIAEWSRRLVVTEPRTQALNGATQARPDLRRAVRGYVRAYASLHGQRKAAEYLGVSRHNPVAVPRTRPHGALRAFRRRELRRRKRAGRLRRPHLRSSSTWRAYARDPAFRHLRQSLEEALLLLCATPLATVEELSRFGRLPTSTLRDRLKRLSERGLVDSVAHHLSVLGTRPQRRYFPTEKGVTAAGAATKGRNHMLRSYPVSKQWFRLLAERLDAVAVLHRVAAMVADADPHQKPVRVDHYRNGPYDILLTMSGGRTIGLIRQGPALPTSRLRYRLRSIERLDSSETPFVTLVLTHADQATRRAIWSLGDPSEHRRTFVATEGELLAGDHTGVVWQQCGSGPGRGRAHRRRRIPGGHPGSGGASAGLVLLLPPRQTEAEAQRSVSLRRAGLHA